MNTPAASPSVIHPEQPIADTHAAPDALTVVSSHGFLRSNLLWSALQWPFRLFCRTWMQVDAHGIDHIDDTQGGVFLLNHQSLLDPLIAAVLLRRPVSFLARDSLFAVPVLGWVLRNTYVIPISREAARGGSIRAAIERLEKGFLVGVFPEGTRSSGEEVLRFRPGFLALIRRTNQPIYPVGIAGTARRLPRGAWFLRPGRVQVVYGAPLSVEETRRLQSSGGNDAELCELAWGRVAECAREANERLRPVPLPDSTSPKS